jgi:chromosomal replication initiation ATPase DnaA
MLNSHLRSELERVAKLLDCTIEALLGPSRLRDLSRRRNAVCHFLRITTKASLHELGAVMERDHTTVMHHVKSFATALKNGDDWALELESMYSKGGVRSTAFSDLARDICERAYERAVAEAV